MNQKVIADIGNAYADEILWDARIHLESICGKIPPDRVKALAKSIVKVLIHAEKAIFKEHPDIIAREIRDFLFVHNAKKEKSSGRAKIHSSYIGGRKTYYTEEQKLYN